MQCKSLQLLVLSRQWLASLVGHWRASDAHGVLRLFRLEALGRVWICFPAAQLGRHGGARSGSCDE